MRCEQTNNCINNILKTIHYRNVVIQGKTNSQGNLNKAIIFQPKTHQFIICTQLNENKLNNNCLFYHHHGKYHYGNWLNGEPHGKIVFRIKQTLIVAEYINGRLQQRSNILVVFQQINRGAIFQYLGEEQWKQISNQQIKNSKDLNKLIQSCKFTNTQPVFPSLLKFCHKYLVNQDQQKMGINLRQTKQGYYRLGYDNGLAIIFDDQFTINSVGMHRRTILGEVGKKFYGENYNYNIEQGLFEKGKTFIYNQYAKPHEKIQKLYYYYQLTGLYFRNQYFSSSSLYYFRYFQQHLKSDFIKDFLTKVVFSSGSIRSDENISQVSQIKGQIIEQKIFPTFRKQLKTNEIDNISKQFEFIPVKNKLQIIKKEAQIMIKSRQVGNSFQTNKKSNKQMQIQNISPIIKNQHQIDLIQYTNNQNKNLNKNINIINPLYIQKTPRIKNKIFSPFKDYKRDYTPSPSRSKSRERLKIFQKKSVQKNKNKQINAQSSPYFVKTQSKYNLNNNKKYDSPLQMLNQSSFKSNKKFKASVKQQIKKSSSIKQFKLAESSNKSQIHIESKQQNEDTKIIGKIYNNVINKGKYKQYIYEPISLNQFNKTKNNNLYQQSKSNKKIIQKSVSKDKLSRYMNQNIKLNI